MDIRAIDRSASSGRSRLHAASAEAKLMAVGLVLLAVVLVRDPWALLALDVALVAVAAASRLDLRLTLGLAAYPALFAAVFAFASAPSALVASSIVLKAVTAALASVILVMTTPYPRVFAPLQRILPELAGDALLMTYRTFFLLAERFGDVLRTIRLRSGTAKGTWFRLRSIAAALGSVLLYAFDLAERDYDVMYVRGYSGRLRPGAPRHRNPAADALVITATAIAVALAIASPYLLGRT